MAIRVRLRLPLLSSGGSAENLYLSPRRARCIYVFGAWRWLEAVQEGPCEAQTGGVKCGEPGHEGRVVFGPGSARDSTSFSLAVCLCPGHEARAKQEGASVRERSRAEVLGRRLLGLQ